MADDPFKIALVLPEILLLLGVCVLLLSEVGGCAASG